MSDSANTKQADTATFVKGLGQLEGDPEFEMYQADEFPHRSSLKDINRRDFLKFMGGSLALAGLASSGCRYMPATKVVPFVQAPEDRIPGVPQQFATISTLGGYAIGLLVTSHEGRPTRIDGNPHHPASVGACDARTQAQIVGLYDPDRLKTPKDKGEPRAWREALAALRSVIENPAESGGNQIAILTETVSSPTMAAVLADFLAKYPNAAWYQYDPVNRDQVREGSNLAFGQDVGTHYCFNEADVVLSLDANFLMEGPAPVRYAHDLMSRRKPTDEGRGMSRIYAIEAAPSLVGVIADHRLPLKPSQILTFVLALAHRLGVPGATPTTLPAGISENFMSGLIEDLRAHPGASAIVAGDHQRPQVHAAVHAINEFLGNFGKTVYHTPPVVAKTASQTNDIKALATALGAGQVKALLILGGNPAYNAPADVNLENLIKRAKISAHLSLYDDETSHACTWQLPASHFLEAWGDGRCFDGLAAIQQPLIQPLYDSKSEIELLDSLLGRSRPGLEIVRSQWAATMSAQGDFETVWTQALSEGFVRETRSERLELATTPGMLGTFTQAPQPAGLELIFAPDPTVFDGRYANNAWLQELPKPITNATWDNALYLSKATAERLGLVRKTVLGTQDLFGHPIAELTVGGRKLEVPVAVNLGQADDTAVLHLGYGRRRAGHIGTKSDDAHGGGFDAYTIRTSDAMWLAAGVQLAKTDRSYPLANTQFHNTLDTSKIDSGRNVIQTQTLAAYLGGEPFGPQKPSHGSEGDSAEEAGHGPLSMYNPAEHPEGENYQWAMTVDLNLCTGCNACVTACQAENNIPSVGKRQVQRGREMHWIRIDRYYRAEGGVLDEANPKMYFQPLTCMQCEKAPCEPVCPVAATVHSKEGLNQMVYNRCVGTRYCSNNCPYKVRRFNFLNYANHHDVPVLKMLHNPDVTVRGRGVMEKCTYCVQRINHARIDAKKENRRLRDGEVKTACQVACPAGAITFGDKNDPASAVGKTRQDKRNYVLLEETNTIPRTTYLGRIHNPNPEIEA